MTPIFSKRDISGPPMSTASGSAPVGWVIPTLLILASSTSVMSTDLYAPTMPDLPGLLDTTPTMVKLTMSLNLAGSAWHSLFTALSPTDSDAAR